MCQIYIEKAAHLHLEFWNLLREDRPDLAKLNDCGIKINSCVAQVESQWNSI